ncbi:MAG: response regulator [Deltaproteobacteria bacterium]|nr:response regulator [Deltaproteobacteria bacterium]
MPDRDIQKKILFVDDDEALRALYMEVLKRAGYLAEEAKNGKTALEKIKKTVFDLVITDIQMPELDGIGLYLNALKDYPFMKDRFIFITGSMCEDSEAKSVLTEMELKYLVKPFEIKELLGMIGTVTGSSPAVFQKPGGKEAGKRLKKRFCWEEDCRVSEKDAYNPRPFTSTVDVSSDGVKIRYIGSPLKPDSVVKIDIKGLRVKTAARIIWSRILNEVEAVSGLKLSDPISSTSIVTVVQAAKWYIPPLISFKKH